MEDSVIRIECGGEEYSLVEAHFNELGFILRNGPVFENTMRPEGARGALFEKGFITKIVVESCREKIAVTPLGFKIYNKMSDFSLKTDLGLSGRSEDCNCGTMTALDFNLEVEEEIKKHGINQGETK